jgi:hypothetical protein
LWSEHFVDRRVKETLRRMLESTDKGLIRLIRKRVPKLTPKEIFQSLRRLDVRIGSLPASLEQPAGIGERPDSLRKKRHREAGAKAAKTRRDVGNVTLKQVIDAGVLTPPVRLFRRYKGHELVAQLLPDGRVEFQGTCYDSGSTSADYARGTITGRRMHTNGWVFWQYQDEKGKKMLLADARNAYLAKKGGAS